MNGKKLVFSKEKWKQRKIELKDWDATNQMKYITSDSWLNDCEGKTPEEAKKMYYTIHKNWLVEVDV